MEPGPLCAGALLAKRGFRVLVVGQNSARDEYPCFGYKFVKRPFLLSAASSPAITKVIQELSLGQLFSHGVESSDIRYQIVQPKARVTIFDQVKHTCSELAREYPDYQGVLSSVLTEIGKYSSDFDKLLQNDLVIPPENFFERRDYSRAIVQNPFYSQPHFDLFEKLNISGMFRDCLSAPLRFTTANAKNISPLVAARCMGAWLFDAKYLRGGLDGLRHLLCERILEQGGDIQESWVASGIEVRRGKVQAVRMSGRKEPTATHMVLTDMSPSPLASMVDPQTWTSRFKALVEDDSAPVLGYAVNLGVKKEVVPQGMARTVFVSSRGPLTNLLRVEQVPQDNEQKAVLNVSCVVPSGTDVISNGALRDEILDQMRWLVPFLDTHLEVIHSPYDGFGPIDLTGHASSDAPPVPRLEQIGKWQLHVPPNPTGLGIENLPHRTGVKGLLMAGAQVVSGLGIETDFIAGWGAAKIAGKMDPSRQRIVRTMRSRVEM